MNAYRDDAGRKKYKNRASASSVESSVITRYAHRGAKPINSQ